MATVKKTDVVILGAGSAGLYSLPQIRRAGRSFIMLDGGVLGTTCALVGCMPSKALIQIADDLQRTQLFAQQGLLGAEEITADIPAVLSRVRSLRDRLSGGAIRHTLQPEGGEFLAENGYFSAPGQVQAGEYLIEATSFVIATGSRPILPTPWQQFGDRVLTTDSLFEQQDLPQRIAVIGLGAIGLELGQALSRLGIEVHGFDQLPQIAGISDPEIEDFSYAVFHRELPMTLGVPAQITELDEQLLVSAGDTRFVADAILVAIGRRPRLDSLRLDQAGITLGEDGLPDFDPATLQVRGHPVFLAGDVNARLPLLHEAGDDGRISGVNACLQQPLAFTRKVPLSVVYTDPQLCHVGARYEALKNSDFVVGEADFESLGRAVVMVRAEGLLQLYFDRQSRLLGAALLAPGAEHLAHFLALAIDRQMTAGQLLKVPYYHPCLEEALYTAILDAYQQLQGEPAIPVQLKVE
ncbi:MAG TPA: dihydrolipoyl dehydrogenase [Gammaproteobacteria bacterium]|nr:dihydrolipoyl dehydrogenase [Gammaproteobacteria bacterium]